MSEVLITDPVEIQRAHAIRQRFFRHDKVLLFPFNPTAHNRALIFPYFYTYTSNPPLVKALAETALYFDDPGVYVEDIDHNSNARLWFIDIAYLPESKVPKLPIDLFIYSSQGHWALLGTPDEFALFAATNTCMEHILHSFPGFHKQIDLFLDDLVDDPHTWYLPEDMYHLLAALYAPPRVAQIFDHYAISSTDELL